MKQLILILAFLLGSSGLQARTQADGMSLTILDSLGIGIKKVMGSDASGNTGTGMLVRCPTCPGGSGGTSAVSITASVPLTITGGLVTDLTGTARRIEDALLALSLTANSAYSIANSTLGRLGAFSTVTGAPKVDMAGSSGVAYLASKYVFATSTSYQATTAGMFVNASSAAGVSCGPCEVIFQANGAGYWDLGASASVPSTLGTTTGFTVTANVTPLLKSSFIDGQGIYVKAQAGTVQFSVTTTNRQQ